MATPTICKNQANAWDIVMAAMAVLVAERDVTRPVGREAAATMRKIRVFQHTTTPTTAATGISAGDLVIDTGNNLIYRYITANTYVDITATS